jgi:hypothetical protein
MDYKEWLSVIAIALTVAAFLPYILSILRGDVRPHVFSWIIWSITKGIVFLAQLEDDAGAGAWPIGVSGGITLMIALLAYLKRADITITRTDRLFLVAALSSLPFWYVTADPLWAVLILTTVDVFGFTPTIRKAWHLPYSESLLFFTLYTIRNLITILALEHYSVTTVLFPAAIAAACIGLTAMVTYRRRAIVE